MDTETQKKSDEVEGGWGNVYAMGMSCAVTWDSKTDLYEIWDHNSKDKLNEYLNNKIVITYNGIQFDSQLLLGNDRKIELRGATSNDKYKWYNLDLYVEILRNMFCMDKSDYPKIIEKIKQTRTGKGVFSLGNVAQATLGISKSGDGADAPTLFQTKQLTKLYSYNLQDVRVLKELFLFAKKYKYIVSGSYDIVKL